MRSLPSAALGAGRAGGGAGSALGAQPSIIGISRAKQRNRATSPKHLCRISDTGHLPFGIPYYRREEKETTAVNRKGREERKGNDWGTAKQRRNGHGDGGGDVGPNRRTWQGGWILWISDCGLKNHRKGVADLAGRRPDLAGEGGFCAGTVSPEFPQPTNVQDREVHFSGS